MRLTSNRVYTHQSIHLSFRDRLRHHGYKVVVDAQDSEIYPDNRKGIINGWFCTSARPHRNKKQEDQSCAHGAHPPEWIFVCIIGRTLVHGAKNDESGEHGKTHQTRRDGLHDF